PAQVERYRARISGPLLDRIDLQLQLGQVPPEELMKGAPGGEDVALTTARARMRVQHARQRQLTRQGCLNARLAAGETMAHCAPDRAAATLLARVAAARGLSARAQHRVLRVARSIADLADRDAVGCDDVAESLAMRLEG